MATTAFKCALPDIECGLPGGPAALLQRHTGGPRWVHSPASDSGAQRLCFEQVALHQAGEPAANGRQAMAGIHCARLRITGAWPVHAQPGLAARAWRRLGIWPVVKSEGERLSCPGHGTETPGAGLARPSRPLSSRCAVNLVRGCAARPNPHPIASSGSREPPHVRHFQAQRQGG